VIADSLRPPLVHARGGHWQLLLRSPANGAAPGADLEEEGDEHRHRRNKQTDGCVERVLPDLPPAVRVKQDPAERGAPTRCALHSTAARSKEGQGEQSSAGIAPL
jgi:hypothetical protein